MMSNKAKIAGPVIAVGAVSVGLVLIGACGIGHHDIYVPPPPLEAGPAAVVETVRDGTSMTAPKVVIPPSPSWQIAPAGPPRRPAGYTPPSSTAHESETETSETSTRPTRTTTPRSTEREPQGNDEPTTSTRTLSIEPTTVAAEEPQPPHTSENDRAPREDAWDTLPSEAAEQVPAPLPEVVETPRPVTPAEISSTLDTPTVTETSTTTEISGSAENSTTTASPTTATNSQTRRPDAVESAAADSAGAGE